MRAVFYPIQTPTDDPMRFWIDAWALKCDHGEVTTDDVQEAFTPQQITNRVIADRMHLQPDVSNLMTQIVAMRGLLGILLTTWYGCSCGIDPLPLAELDPEADRGPQC